ncbi:Protein transport protein S9 plasma membrane t-SNARE [Lambiella insularis]|nr:Protein transport protein S9 plasma membrane t-SNARE [Lambiella insularis]
MRKFGFGKKNDDGDDANRSALFGSKSKSKSPAPSTNPYAQPTLPPDPYTQAKMNVYARPETTGYPVQDGAANRYGNDSKVGMEKSYTGANGAGGRYRYKAGGYNGGGYGADKYGAQGGYGADKYGIGAQAPAQTAGSRYGAGGYGGLGGAGAYDDGADENRDALFGGAKDRTQQKQPTSSSYSQPPPYEETGAPGGYGGSSSQNYGTYQEDRQLTAEEEEEEEVSATKQQIRFIKQEDVSSTRNALRMAQQAEETGRSTLARLGAQGENLYNTEKNLDIAHNQNRIADDRAKELKKLNRSMFAVHVSNPFTAGQRSAQRDQDVIDRHLDERDQRESTRRAGYQQNQRLQQNFKELQPGTPGYGQARGKNLADRAKYQFEADSDDEEMENEIDGNLDLLSGAAGRLNALARATGQEVDEQNKLLDRIADKSDRVDIGIAANRAKLDRIR